MIAWVKVWYIIAFDFDIKIYINRKEMYKPIEVSLLVKVWYILAFDCAIKIYVNSNEISCLIELALKQCM